MKRSFWCVILVLLCHYAVQAQEASQPYYSIFLLGDAGEPYVGEMRHIKVLKQHLDAAGENSAMVFLGDNIYPKGMPPKEHPLRARAEKSIDAQIDLVKDYKGETIFIPGNHDWEKGKKDGWTNALIQERYIERKLDSMNVFLPDDGCPGPEEIHLTDEITLVVFNFQWFLHPWDKPRQENGGCDTKSTVEFFQQLETILKQNKHKKVLVAAHHPLITYGIHGGVTTFKDHLFPFTAAKKNLYIPLPVIGSIHPFYRKYIGNIQDATHPKYKALKKVLMGYFEQYPDLIYASGHEHSLQYSQKDSVHYVVSGSGAKTTYVKEKGYAQFVREENGFARLDYFSDGEVKLSFWNGGDRNKPIYSKTLMKKPFVPQLTLEEFLAKYDFSDSTVVVVASNRYNAGKTHVKLLGANYRDVWEQEVEVPVFDIGKEHGGLKIVKRGGGMQTNSLRLEAADGKQYVIRSIEKYPERAVPEIFRGTFAVALARDQMSAAHPYGAFVIPPLAEAAGIYHTNPKLVYVPDDPRLGIHRELFGNTLALYEERPNTEHSDLESFGKPKKIVNTFKVLEELLDDNDNEVDQKWVLKSRLFDLWIGDWDRHDDQWRWGRFKGKHGRLYRPIPRDRDQTFFVNEGFFPRIWSRKWAIPKFQGFSYDLRWPPGFMFNARYFDRSFLNEPDREDWLKATEKLQKAMTDEVIENAIRQWPDSIYKSHGEEIIAKLKARRERMKDFALQHYLFLSKSVNVMGSNKMEQFAVERKENGDVEVTVRKISKKGNIQHKIYKRLFKFGETKEIRLYGRGGEDVFKITGEGKKGIRVRVIGGADMDQLDDESHVAGPSKKNLFYDTKEGSVIKAGNETRKKTSNDPKVNEYDRKAFQYNQLAPLIFGNFNPDDGVFLGAGFLYTDHGFRKTPFKSRHIFLASYAIRTSSFSVNYQGTFTGFIGNWDLDVDLSARAPNFVNNFFGLGNESEFDDDIDEIVPGINRPINFYRLRFQEFNYKFSLSRRLGQFGRFSVGPEYLSVEIQESEGGPRFIEQYQEATNDNFIRRTDQYVGLFGELNFDRRDNRGLPTSGILWNNRFRTLGDIDDDDNSVASFNSELAFYHSFRFPARVTFAVRVGGGWNFGDYEFYNAQILDGPGELRGFRRTRFYGDQKFFSNVELRMKLFSFRSVVFPGSFGILGFHDIGRVWLDGEDSDTWHRGYGGGLWVAPLNFTVLSTELGLSEEGTLFYFRLGFIF